MKTPTSSKAERRRDAGVTLLELLTVLAILSFSTLAFGNLTRAPSDGESVAAGAETITSALKKGKSMAAYKGAEVDVAINIEAREVRIDGAEHAAPLPREPEISARVAREVSGEARVAVVRFLPDGSNTGAKIEFALGDARRQVSLHWLTGVIRVE